MLSDDGSCSEDDRIREALDPRLKGSVENHGNQPTTSALGYVS